MTLKNIINHGMRDLTTFGGTPFYALVTLLTLILNRQLGFKLLLGFFITGAITILIRSFYFKNRPKKQSYTSYIEKMDASSFPSWHSSRAVLLSLLFAQIIPNLVIQYFLFLIALLVIYSRIYLKRHDITDVIGGIVLGVLTFLIV